MTFLGQPLVITRHPVGRNVRLAGSLKGVTTLSMNSHQARDQAAALFKKKEEQPQESRKATEYEADRHAKAALPSALAARIKLENWR